MMEPDPALIEEAVHLLGLKGASPVVTRSNKEDHMEDITSEIVKQRRLKGDINRGEMQQASKKTMEKGKADDEIKEDGGECKNGFCGAIW